MSCGVGHRQGLDLAVLWLWCRPEVTAPIRPLAWEPPCAAGAALERQKKKKRGSVGGGEAGRLALKWSVREGSSTFTTTAVVPTSSS